MELAAPAGLIMTAVFAYADADIVFVAGDSRRTARLGAYPTLKVHSWGMDILFAQAGEGLFLSKLIAEITANADFFGLTTLGFHEAIAAQAPAKWVALEEYCARLVPPEPPPSGTLLVASIGGNVWKVDFQTHDITPVGGNIGADGADAAGYLAFARYAFDQLRQANGGRVPLDHWASLCIEEAVIQHPRIVSWPANLVITRPSGLGDRILVRRRLHSAADQSHPIFTTA